MTGLQLLLKRARLSDHVILCGEGTFKCNFIKCVHFNVYVSLTVGLLGKTTNTGVLSAYAVNNYHVLEKQIEMDRKAE